MDLLPSLRQLLQPFSQQMTAPTFARFCTILLGWIFARRHTVTGALRACDRFPKHFSAYHRVFSAARWSLDAVGLAMLGLILSVFFPAAATVFLVIDDSGKPKSREKKTTRAVFYSTVTSVDALTVMAWYCPRWTVEVAIRDSKQELGCGQVQGWSEQAVKQTAPTLMLIHSLVVPWFAQEGHRFYRVRLWPWYRHKTAISFADMLATLRCRIIRQHLRENLTPPTAIQGSRKALASLLRLVKLAA